MMTLNNWYENWMELYKKRTVKEGTATTYRDLYYSRIAPQLGERNLSDLKSFDIQTLLNGLADHQYANETISIIHILLNSMLKFAEKSELIEKNPCCNIALPKGKPQTHRIVFTQEQQKIFIQYCDKIPLGDMFCFALYTGLRGGELCALRWEDVDLQSHTIHVQHTLKFTSGKGYWLDSPKTQNSIREIPLLPQAEKILIRLKKGNPEYVFSAEERPVTKNQIRASLQKMRKEFLQDGIDFPYFTLHSTRHTFATRCIEGGMKPKVLQKILGHSRLQTTMDLYVSVLEDEKSAEMHAVEKYFM